MEICFLASNTRATGWVVQLAWAALAFVALWAATSYTIRRRTATVPATHSA
jgi:hypothetical protein